MAGRNSGSAIAEVSVDRLARLNGYHRVPIERSSWEVSWTLFRRSLLIDGSLFLPCGLFGHIENAASADLRRRAAGVMVPPIADFCRVVGGVLL